MMDDTENLSDPTQEEGDDVAKLSIVVRAQVEGDTTPRVWLIYEYEGTRLAVATSADSPYELIRETEVPTLTDDDAVRIKELSTEERARFEDAMRRISDVSDAGLEIWTPLRTSAAFAAGVWETTVGEELSHSVFGRSTPQRLARSIGAANTHDLGLAVDREESIDLQLSPRKRGLRPDQDDEDQSQRHGHSL